NSLTFLDFFQRKPKAYILPCIIAFHVYKRSRFYLPVDVTLFKGERVFNVGILKLQAYLISMGYNPAVEVKCKKSNKSSGHKIRTHHTVETHASVQDSHNFCIRSHA